MPERPFSSGKSPSVRIVPWFGRVNHMQSPTEMTPIETIIDDAERQRKLLRRVCWAGVAFVAVAILFVVSQPLYVRWQLRQQGWKLEPSPGRGGLPGRGLPDWAPQWADFWFGKFERVHLKRSPLRPGDLDLLQRLRKVGWIHLESTDVSELALEKVGKLESCPTCGLSILRM